jgi:hypothetical protein
MTPAESKKLLAAWFRDFGGFELVRRVDGQPSNRITVVGYAVGPRGLAWYAAYDSVPHVTRIETVDLDKTFDVLTIADGTATLELQPLRLPEHVAMAKAWREATGIVELNERLQGYADGREI